MPVQTRFTNFSDFHDFWKGVATAFLGTSKIPTVNFEIYSFSWHLLKVLFSTDINLCLKKLNSGYKLKDFSAMLSKRRFCSIILINAVLTLILKHLGINSSIAIYSSRSVLFVARGLALLLSSTGMDLVLFEKH